jgi:uncharacterized protein YuzE
MKSEAAYAYDSGLDILSLSTGGDYEESAAIAALLMADFDIKGQCIGFEFLDAADLFLPFLCPDEYPKPDIDGEDLTIAYCADTDTLSFWNSSTVSYSETVIEHCIAHLDAEGDPVGFTLEKASERILPLLLMNERRKLKPCG